MSKHIDLKHKVQSINTKSEFYAILDEAMLSEREKQILQLYYIEKKTYLMIGDELGFSEDWVKKQHYKILRKIEQLL